MRAIAAQCEHYLSKYPCVSGANEGDDDFASAHIMVSSPALPGFSDVVWVYFQNVIPIDHQSFGIVIRERLIIILSSV